MNNVPLVNASLVSKGSRWYFDDGSTDYYQHSRQSRGDQQPEFDR